jgi:signal transduction histidine kinase
MTPAPAKPLPASALCEMLLRQSPGCAWLLQRDGAFHAVFGGAPRVFGRPAAELQTLPFTDLFAPPARPCWAARIARVFAGETLAAAARFGPDALTFSIAMFPVQAPDRGIAFAACVAREMPEGGLVLRMLDALESDRARLPQLLHDRVGQTLSAAGLQLDLLRMDLAETAGPVPQRIGEIQDMLDTAMGLVRDVSRELNPAVAERLGLRAALDGLAGRLRTDFKGNVRVFADATAQPAPQTAAAMFRIAQEAAGRATRSTPCSAIQILLKSLRDGVALEIRDNGPAFEADAALERGGLELLVMQHFADCAGIELQIETAPGQGTVVRAISRSADAAAC